MLAVMLFALGASAGSPVGNASSRFAATPASADAEAQALLHRASDRLSETTTVRFNLEVEGDTYIDDGEDIRLVSARGALSRPASVDVEFQVELLGSQTVSIRMISIGEESWTTDLLTGQWAPSPEEFGYNPTVLFDDQDGLGPVAGRLVDPVIEGREEIANREAWKVIGTVSDEVIEPLTSGTIKGDEITISLWLDVETGDMLRLGVAEPENAPKPNPATWTMTLTGHNSEVSIQRPDIEE